MEVVALKWEGPQGTVGLNSRQGGCGDGGRCGGPTCVVIRVFVRLKKGFQKTRGNASKLRGSRDWKQGFRLVSCGTCSVTAKVVRCTTSAHTKNQSRASPFPSFPCMSIILHHFLSFSSCCFIFARGRWFRCFLGLSELELATSRGFRAVRSGLKPLWDNEVRERIELTNDENHGNGWNWNKWSEDMIVNEILQN